MSQFCLGCVQQLPRRYVDIEHGCSQYMLGFFVQGRCFLLLFVIQLALKGLGHDVRLILFIVLPYRFRWFFRYSQLFRQVSLFKDNSLFFQFVGRCSVNLDAGPAENANIGPLHHISRHGKFLTA